MTREQAAEMIRNSNQICYVEFMKRLDGSTRKMLCRSGVKKGQNGNGLKWNPEKHGLIVVFDMGYHGYRAIPIEGITFLRIKGQEYQIN